MREKILYFMISCVFAIVTTSSAAPNTSQPVFRETTTDRLFEAGQGNSEKNYVILTLEKVKMESRLAPKEDIFWSEVFFKTEGSSVPGIKTELIEKTIGVRADYTILSRYKERVIRN